MVTHITLRYVHYVFLPKGVKYAVAFPLKVEHENIQPKLTFHVKTLCFFEFVHHNITRIFLFMKSYICFVSSREHRYTAKIATLNICS